MQTFLITILCKFMVLTNCEINATLPCIILFLFALRACFTMSKITTEISMKTDKTCFMQTIITTEIDKGCFTMTISLMISVVDFPD